MPELRFDLATVRGVTQTPQGGVRLEAALSKACVLRYRDTAGQEWSEFVPREELAREDSLATLRGAPVVDLHPEDEDGKPVMVTTENYRALARGHAHDDVRMDGDYLVATLTVNDAAEVAAILAGDRADVSAGYSCDLEETHGVYEGESYQRVQRNRRYNHLGLGPPGWGRAGSDVGLRLDGAAVAVRVDAPAEGTMKRKIKLRSREVTVDMAAEGEDKKLQDALDEEMSADDEKVQKKDAEIAGLTATCESLTGKLTEALTEVATLGAQLKAQEAAAGAAAAPAEPSEEVLDAALATREALRADAAKVLGKDADLKGKKPGEIRRLALAKVAPAVKLDGLDEVVITKMFDAAVAAASGTPAPRNDALGAAHAAAQGRNPTTPEVKTDGDEDLGAKLRQRTRERSHAALTTGAR